MVENKTKYLTILKAIQDEVIIENDFLKSFMTKVGLQISKNYSISEKQVEVLDRYMVIIRNLIIQNNQEYEKEALNELNHEAKNINLNDLLVEEEIEKKQ